MIRYFTNKGRLRSLHYFGYMAALTVPVTLLGNAVEGGPDTMAILYTFALWPLAVYMQSNLMTARLHDTDRSAWWQLVFWVPTAVFTVLEITVGKMDTSNMNLHFLDVACRLIALVAAMTIWVRRGTKGPNQYGDDPIPPGEEEIKAHPPLYLLKRNREEAHRTSSSQ